MPKANSLKGDGKSPVSRRTTRKLSFDEITNINSLRRDVGTGLLKDQDTRTLARRLFNKIRSSVFADIVCDPVFWTVNALFWIVRYVGDGNPDNTILFTLPSFGSPAMTITASIIVFSLVFYVTTCYNRFWAQYECAMSCEGRIFDSMLLAKSIMSPEAAWRLYRHLNAAHLLAYTGLGTVYDEGNFFYPFNNMYHLLLPAEVDRIERIGFRGGSAFREVLSWAVDSVSDELRCGRLPDFQAFQAIASQILVLRAKLAALYDYADLQIPFSYVGLMNTSVFFYLHLFSFTVARSYDNDIDSWKRKLGDSVVEYCCVLFFSWMMLGLRWLAYRLEDPLGNDMEDLAILHYVKFMVLASAKVLGAAPVLKSTDLQERELCALRGMPFVYDGPSLVPVDSASCAPRMDVKVEVIDAAHVFQVTPTA
eukprot:CAMPEP_0196657320 /NCGR_PEP_ID=MMETSP1086-20130531/22575_1 /TAXON_ID=77921 /ORGANISM="Cyanoptyche  gloeocystis , Strain SAG4.97" /LENGTH=422 /DNA_ID=CAMNT_0041990389 /DNA_START=181 /DNA_END=1449 /DNA_ORIENTATION=+